MAGLLDILNPMSGLLSPDEAQNVAGNSMLQLSANLMAGSGWSPHPVSFGSVLGPSLENALQAQQQMTGNLLQLKHMKNQLEMEQIMMPFRQAAIAQLTGQNQVPPPPMATATDIQGNQFPTNQLPPYLSTNPNAATNAAQAIQQNQATQPTINLGGQYFTPTQLFKQGQALAWLGMPGGPEMMNIAVSHDPSLAAQMEYAKAQATMPFDVVKNLARGGTFRPVITSPGQQGVSSLAYLPPQIQQALAGSLGGYGGGYPTSPVTPQPVPQAPIGAPSNGSTTMPQSGYAAPSNYGGSVNTAMGPVPIIKGMSLQTAEEQKAQGTANIEMVKDINSKASQAMVDKSRNLQLLDVLNRGMVELGPASAQLTFTRNLAKELLPDSTFNSLEKNFGVKDPTNSQEFGKYAYQGAIAVAKQAFQGRISTKEVEMTINSMPGNNLTEKANRAMLLYSNMEKDRDISAQIALQQWRQSGKPMENFPAWFNQNFPYGNVIAPQSATPNTGGVPQPGNSGWAIRRIQ